MEFTATEEDSDNDTVQVIGASGTPVCVDVMFVTQPMGPHDKIDHLLKAGVKTEEEAQWEHHQLEVLETSGIEETQQETNQNTQQPLWQQSKTPQPPNPSQSIVQIANPCTKSNTQCRASSQCATPALQAEAIPTLATEGRAIEDAPVPAPVTGASHLRAQMGVTHNLDDLDVDVVITEGKWL